MKIYEVIDSFSEPIDENFFDREQRNLLKRGWKKFGSAYYLYNEFGDEPFSQAEAIEKEKFYDKNGFYLMGSGRSK